jgi:uncharacterized protein YfaS (alpha-2-macroglobulin family)
LTAGLGSALPQFEPTAYESNDDIAARVLVAASLHSLPASIAGLSPSAYANLPRLTTSGVSQLLERQYPDGGWPWFNDPLEFSDPTVTADALQALVASGQHGSRMTTAVIRARRFLHYATNQVTASERADILMVLATSGPPPTRLSQALYGNSIIRLHLSPGPLADLGVALNRAHDVRRSTTVASVLDSKAVVSATGAHWESGNVDYWSGSAIDSTIRGLNALLTLRPHDPFVPASVRWLMLSRQDSGWDSPHDTAQAIAALAAYARAAREGHADYNYRVAVNGPVAMSGRYAPGNQRAAHTLTVPVSKLQRATANAVSIGRATTDGTLGTGPLYYVAQLRYYVPANLIAPRNAGISVSRKYLDLSGHAITSVRAGTAIKVRITLHTDSSLFYLNLDDPIPAGCEPIDETLNTSPQGLVRQQHWWWNWNSTGPRDLSLFISHSDLRADRVSLYSYFLPPGTYHYTYLAQATTPGTYGVAPTHAEEKFFPEVFGRSAGQVFTVR